MGWLDPINRREITLILFAITVFLISYNLDTSIRQFGFDPVSKQGAVFNKLGLGGPSIIGKDGRRPPEWRDSFEKLAFGDWHWDEGHTAGDQRTKVLSGDNFGALWHDKDKIYNMSSEEDGTMHDSIQWWGDSIPNTKIIKHVPGFTILDNVYFFNNSIFLVSDPAQKMPPIGHSQLTVHVVSPSNATKALGRFGGKLRGVSWLCANKHPHNTTLMSLWRMYSSLDPSIDSSGRTVLPPPRRIIFPSIPAFSDKEGKLDDNITKEVLYAIPRRRSDAGFHPYLLKVAFPSLGLLHQADFEDYEKMRVPFILPRVVFANSELSSSESSDTGRTYAFPSEVSVSSHWWEPVRRSVEGFFEHDALSRRKGKVGITYVHRQWDHTGAKMKTEDHNALVEAMSKLQADLGHEVSIVSSLDDETSWFNRMKAISRSQIILGVHGNHLLDAAYMMPSPKTTLIEFFPRGTFTRDRQLMMDSIGFNYTAWWHDGRANIASPFQAPPHGEVSIDAKAVVKHVRDILSRR